jgi:phage terminase small subunit
MGTRGLQRQPGSVRAEREGGVVLDAPEAIIVPRWLTPNSKKEFKRLVADLTSANVPIKQADSHAIATAASILAGVIEWTAKEHKAETLKDQLACAKRVASYQRDSQKWLEMIGATPASRARLGLKAAPKETGTIAALIAQRKNAGQ